MSYDFTNNAKEEKKEEIISLPIQFYFGGKYSKKFVSIGITQAIKPKWAYTIGGIYYYYSYTSSFYGLNAGYNKTTYWAISGKVSYDYLHLFNNKLTLLGSFQADISYSRIIVANGKNIDKINIYGPVLFLNQEIDYSISNHFKILFMAGIGYGNGIIKKGVTSDKSDFRTDRDNGYGEIRAAYGIRYIF